ncbi:hypothetical protein EVU96_25015 [Bacillus infantis]|uniref:hypothetical protein n=1 Tax=Bacillus infantis TaxID=324767 RepID=UPI00101C125F|nr:hypothetical protein [Bacillus infantis]RYI25077.1 hypothetical protein EVU96_25015 [Bacillus infantis]
MIIELLRSDGFITVNKNLARAMGIDAAIMYSELISKQKYFKDRGQLSEDGYFFNTVENMEADTTLTKYQQAKAIKALVKANLIHQDNRGLPQKRYFKINEDESVIAGILLPYSNSTSKSKKTEQLNVKEVDGNKNKDNKSKINKGKEIYIISDVNDVFRFYSQKYFSKFRSEHPAMTEEKLNELTNNYDELSSFLDIDQDTWMKLVDYHFRNLSPKNNGNILSFLSFNGGHGCVSRYLEEIERLEEAQEKENFSKYNFGF